ncbi:SDR family NAD(P)-dependent oxidoreductase [Nocardioides sp. 1609]|uniref:SDR family oxidoreductase n=1 Tax=Nocardioides sp. 1609 TaxID=2508327 RepID=UPI00106F384D|nr:SDR family NAD(P)-dependent oxidoreductase [Nocardioides sp. 1609]
MHLTDNTIFIPGGTSGIGLALATRLQAKGNTVIIGGRRTHLLDELAAEHGLGTVEIDTSSPESVRTAVQTLLAGFPSTNMVITSAGIMELEDWHTSEGFLDVAERTVTTNLLGTIRVIAALVEHLQTQPRAAIATVSSGLAFIPLTVTPTYNATKAAIHMLTEGIRLQLADTNVEVIEIVPPAVRTTLLGQENSERAMPLDEYADETIELLAVEPSTREVLVERVKFLRHAAERGDYDQVVSMVNGPH